MSEQGAIVAALAKIQAGVHAVGIGKLRKNHEQKFNFRGIDDALSAFAPLLTEHGVMVVPSYSEITITDRPTKSGGTTYNARLCGRFTFIAAADGSTVEVGPFYAEANDGQDKAISKATSVAYRNALFLTFCVPHEPAIGGDPDGISEGDDKEAARAQDWCSVVAGVKDIDALNALKEECIADYGMRDKVPPKVRAAFSSRQKELQA